MVGRVVVFVACLVVDVVGLVVDMADLDVDFVDLIVDVVSVGSSTKVAALGPVTLTMIGPVSPG